MQVLQKIMSQARNDASLYADDKYALKFFQRRLVHAAKTCFKDVGVAHDDTLTAQLCENVARTCYARPYLLYDGESVSESEKVANIHEVERIIRADALRLGACEGDDCDDCSVTTDTDEDEGCGGCDRTLNWTPTPTDSISDVSDDYDGRRGVATDNDGDESVVTVSEVDDRDLVDDLITKELESRRASDLKALR